MKNKVKLERTKVREWKSDIDIIIKYLDKYQDDRQDRWLIEAYKQLAETRGSIDSLVPYRYDPSGFPLY